MLPEHLQELRIYVQWCVWRYEANGQAKPAKVPYSPRTGHRTSVTNPETWGTYDEALAAAPNYSGIGFVLTESDPYSFIDLDVAPGEAPNDEQKAIYASFKSYAERSPGGNGLHIIVKGKVPTGRRRGKVEIYSSQHYMTMTGHIERAVPIADEATQLQSLWAYMGGESSASPTHDDAPQIESDDAVLSRAANATNGEKFKSLYDGRWQGNYPSQSEADQALMNILAFYTKNTTQIIRLFHASALGQRDKAKRGDYLNHMVTKAFDRDFPLVDASAIQQQIASKVNADRIGDPSDELVVRNLAGVIMKSIEYVWPGWFPIGYVTIVAGESGAAKTTVVADVVARITTGNPFPGEPETARRQPRRALWIGSEDGMEDMTVPRLTACGANLNNVFEIQGALRNGERVSFSMQDHISKAGATLQRANDKGEPYAILVIDPITSYLSGQFLRKVDLSDAGQLRSILEPWLVLAQKFHISIVCITHFMKDTTRSMIHRVLGSAAFAQTCRSLIAVVERPDDEDPYAKALLQVKTNLPEYPGGAWLFSTEKVCVGNDPANGRPIHATRPRWDRLDKLLTQATLIGTSGAKSEKPNLFVGWLRQKFAKTPLDQGLRVSDVRAAALAVHIATAVWWDKHSGEYLDKRNIGGEWWCRPKQ